MKKHIYYPSSDGKTKLHGVIWEPETEPKAIVQISHGMVEYVERYEGFAAFLNEHGILVAGNVDFIQKFFSFFSTHAD